MAENSKIEWTDATWNPIVGCSVKSPGCANCYAMPMAARIERMGTAPHYAGTTTASKAGPVYNGHVARAPESILTKPLHWRKPRKIFVNSMGDLFHENVPDDWIARVFAVMALAPQHTFQVLTKRADRMRDYAELAHRCGEHWLAGLPDAPAATWPLPNVWLGVSAEDQRRADERIPHLLATPAAVRFVSLEPLLGPVDLRKIEPDGDSEVDALNAPLWQDEIENWRGSTDDWEEEFLEWYGLSAMPAPGPMYRPLDWVIVGGESGPGARPMHPDWARSLRDQCVTAGVAFFMKQMTKKAPIPDDLMIRQMPA